MPLIINNDNVWVIRDISFKINSNKITIFNST